MSAHDHGLLYLSPAFLTRWVDLDGNVANRAMHIVADKRETDEAPWVGIFVEGLGGPSFSVDAMRALAALLNQAADRAEAGRGAEPEACS
jgi:hypothetical protein